jgi:hypothetical protein
MQIDEDALDVEWLEQPSLMVKYARHSAKARQDMDRAKEKLETVKADLDQKIRSNPDKFDLQKITEGAILSVIQLHDGYKDAMDKYIDAKYEADIAQLAVRAVDTKKAALENLVRLYGQQYFAGPSVPRDLNREWKKREEQKMANSKVRMKRTRE